jgi:hypothetical protein
VDADAEGIDYEGSYVDAFGNIHLANGDIIVKKHDWERIDG